MNYIRIDDFDMLNGDGIGVVLWVAGCNHNCEECHNPETWNPNNGQLFTDKSKQEIFQYLNKDYIHRITFTGGDPLFPNNRDTLTKLAKEIKELFPDKKIWCYTGYLYEQVKDLPIMNYIDVLIDGPYVKKLRDVSLHWVGSSNQKVIKLYDQKSPEDHC